MQICAYLQSSGCDHDGGGQQQGVPLSFATTVVDEDLWALVPVGGETFSLMLRPFSVKNLSLEMKVVAVFLSKLQFTIMIQLWYMTMFTSWDMEVLSGRASVPKFRPSGMSWCVLKTAAVNLGKW